MEAIANASETKGNLKRISGDGGGGGGGLSTCMNCSTTAEKVEWNIFRAYIMP